MSQYANIVAAEHSLPYYRSGTIDNVGTSAPMPMTVPPTQGPQHQSTNNWPQYYPDPSLVPSSFPSYISEAGPSLSPSPYASPLQSGAISAPLTSVASASSPSGFRDIIAANSSHVDYQTQPSPYSDYPTSSQRAVASPSSPHQPTTYPALYAFGNNRQRSPSSHTSISDYGTGTKGWESPGLDAVEEMRYTPSHAGVVDVDGSSEQVTEAGSRHSSVPASTTTSSSSQPSVKVEPTDPDDCFVMELPEFSPTSLENESSDALGHSSNSRRTLLSRRNLLSQSLAPRAEVPLRATGASEEMRCMMGVFRLNPFAMHSLSNMDDKLGDKEGLKELEAYGGDGQPLEEEPLTFEFQLEIDGLSNDDEQEHESAGVLDPEIRRPPGLEPEEESQLRSFSPSFELHPDDIDGGHDSAQEMTFASNIAIQGQSQESDHDYDHEQDQQSESWPEADCSSVSELDTSSTTSCSTHTPLSGSPKNISNSTLVQVGYEHHHDLAYPLSAASAWDAVNEQYQDVERGGQISSVIIPSPLPAMGKASPAVYSHANLKVSNRLHTTTSHPYLRRSLQNQHALHNHSQSFLYSPPEAYPQAPPSPQPGPSHLQPPVYRSHSSHQLAVQQSSLRYMPHPDDVEQNHVPFYSNSAQVPASAVGDVQHLVGPVSPAYIRPGRDMRPQELEYEAHAYAYSPRNPDGVHGYTQSAYTSPHVGVHGGQHTIAPNRRWSLPDTGGGHGHGVGMGGPFLGNV
ncbi:hypothetical protein CPB84DRAFT_1772011 [Gymnopilus junonius]|uniref:Uncharacterized protein n=1 Tax=Gymnopilus junonius TaxID=109634 RepID=A0A9P5NV68_GYMJU|nr:hypothetical protein CPB84DRAFT_1772011 [Gymnopilus junonius]